MVDRELQEARKAYGKALAAKDERIAALECALGKAWRCVDGMARVAAERGHHEVAKGLRMAAEFICDEAFGLRLEVPRD